MEQQGCICPKGMLSSHWHKSSTWNHCDPMCDGHIELVSESSEVSRSSYGGRLITAQECSEGGLAEEKSRCHQKIGERPGTGHYDFTYGLLIPIPYQMLSLIVLLPSPTI